MRKGRDHRGEIKGDPIAVEPLVIEQRQISRGGSGGRDVGDASPQCPARET